MSSLITQNLFQLSTSQVIENHITVKTACEITGYNGQYIRRLLRAGRLEAIKIGQVWLINLVSLDNYLAARMASEDRRCGPR
jgi:excisionase family DNA binding protein